MSVQVTADGTLEVLSPFHWWCRDCGRWEVCDDADRCRECAWMRGRRGAPRASAGARPGGGAGLGRREHPARAPAAVAAPISPASWPSCWGARRYGPVSLVLGGELAVLVAHGHLAGLPRDGGLGGVVRSLFGPAQRRCRSGRPGDAAPPPCTGSAPRWWRRFSAAAAGRGMAVGERALACRGATWPASPPGLQEGR